MQKNRNLFLNSRDIHNTCIMYMYLLDAPFLQIIEHQALKIGQNRGFYNINGFLIALG